MGAGTARAESLADLELEDLFALTVTSVAKKSQRLSEAPAAIFVLTGEDIRRLGVRSIPEALRVVPGLAVSRVSANQWAISARGFNSVFQSKLLVLMDGRSVYTSLFGGVYWDVQDTLLEDIDRIEVIRGPGGTLWGANAVNGVINIVTKSAKDTQGGVIMGGAGNVEQGFVGARYGGKLGDNVHFRLYGKYFKRDSFLDYPTDTFASLPPPYGTDAIEANDATDQGRGGWRLDWDASERDFVTFQGDIYGGTSGVTASMTDVVPNPFFPPAALPPGFIGYMGLPYADPSDGKVRGGNVILRWEHTFSEDSEIYLQTYYDRSLRDDVLGDFTWDVWDVDLQQRIPFFANSEIVWGLGYRGIWDELIPNVPRGGFEDETDFVSLFSGFIQGELPLLDEHVRLTLGLKVEHNDYTAWEFQPNVRGAWLPNPHHTVWASIARAVRMPVRANSDLELDFADLVDSGQGFDIPGLSRFLGNPDFESETVIAYELGYRAEPIPGVTLDIAAYYNDYDSLVSLDFTTPAAELELYTDPTFGPGLIPVRPAMMENSQTGFGYGVEVAAGWKVFDYWRLSSAYTYNYLETELEDGMVSGVDSYTTVGPEDSQARHLFNFRSQLDLPYDFELDMIFLWSDRIRRYDIDSWERLDIRLGWEPIPGLDLTFMVQNVIDAGHKEWTDQDYLYLPTVIPRSFYGSVAWHF